ncbi:MAG: glycosyltransferase family 1 protein [Bacteroidia bacterium]|nr:glycosyltransferase family 1 protein [Bacteroidia bacterium]
MNKTNLYLMDMSNAQNTSGVDRYINTLIKGLENYTDIQVHWIQLIHDNNRLMHDEVQFSHYVKYTIPLPEQSNEIISQRFWMRKYNKHVYQLTRHLFEGKKNCIVHLHTLNLIDLALYIKSQTTCKVITHLHCMPWKGHFNRDIKKFKLLYHQYYLLPTKHQLGPEYVSNNCELQSYNDAHHVICVTQCAKEFLSRVKKTKKRHITIIPNGINDVYDNKTKRKFKTSKELFRCLYVGVVSQSKGLKYILQSLRKVQNEGYKISLDIAGICPPQLSTLLKEEYSELSLNFLGRIPYDELKKLYVESDIGLIASLQEQASYVAVEMCMFGLPVVTTAVDGLDELFTDEVNALKVNTKFSKVFGLSVDVEMMADKIIKLIKNKALRKKLSANARKLYESELTLEQMMERTVSVYNNVLKGLK